MSAPKFDFFRIFVFAQMMLGAGTFTTLFAKIQFETTSTGVVSCSTTDDVNFDCPFAKPWFSVLEMKAAMAFCLVLYYGLGWGKEPGVPDPSMATIKSVRGITFQSPRPQHPTTTNTLPLTFISYSEIPLIRCFLYFVCVGWSSQGMASGIARSHQHGAWKHRLGLGRLVHLPNDARFTLALCCVFHLLFAANDLMPGLFTSTSLTPTNRCNVTKRGVLLPS
jgi:hypothetical protein